MDTQKTSRKETLVATTMLILIGVVGPLGVLCDLGIRRSNLRLGRQLTRLPEHQVTVAATGPTSPGCVSARLLDERAAIGYATGTLPGP